MERLNTSSTSYWIENKRGVREREKEVGMWREEEVDGEAGREE